MALSVSDLTELQRTYLGVVAVGLVPSRLAGDPSFRLDYLTAVCWALSCDEPPSANLVDGGPACQPQFEDALRDAMRGLEEKAAVSFGAVPPPGTGLIAMHEPDRWLTDWSQVDTDTTPRIVDKFLAHECLDAIFRHGAVRAFLMERYAESSEVWQRLTAQGYGDPPGP